MSTNLSMHITEAQLKLKLSCPGVLYLETKLQIKKHEVQVMVVNQYQEGAPV